LTATTVSPSAASSATPSAAARAEANAAPNAPVLTSEQIQGLLPHRYPFALVDRVIEHEPGKRAVRSRTSPSMSPSSRAISPVAP